MKEQIEHIAKVIHDSDIADINTFPISMSECLGKHGARRTGAAIALVKAGYREQSEWISVEDRLPEDEIPVLVFTAKGTYYVGYYYKAVTSPSFTGFYADSCRRDVTHWMPLPEPPEMKGGAEGINNEADIPTNSFKWDERVHNRGGWDGFCDGY